MDKYDVYRSCNYHVNISTNGFLTEEEESILNQSVSKIDVFAFGESVDICFNNFRGVYSTLKKAITSGFTITVESVSPDGGNAEIICDSSYFMDSSKISFDSCSENTPLTTTIGFLEYTDEDEEVTTNG